MKTILIIYWSQTGNTEAMAHAIARDRRRGEPGKGFWRYLKRSRDIKKAKCICSGLSGYGRRGSGRGRDGTVCNKSEPFVSGK